MEVAQTIPGPYAPFLSLVMRFALSILGGSFLLGKADQDAEPGPDLSGSRSNGMRASHLPRVVSFSCIDVGCGWRNRCKQCHYFQMFLARISRMIKQFCCARPAIQA
jgi:hypothetical protein